MVTRSKVVPTSEAEAAAPETAPQQEVPAAPDKLIARVRLVVGRSCHAHGMNFTDRETKTVVDEDLIEEFQNDGNFAVELVSADVIARSRQAKRR